MTTPTTAPAYRVTPADKRAFWSIMLPALIEGFVTQLFSIIDTLMLGNTAESAINIASVSLANTPHGLMASVASAFCIGATTTIAFYSGQRKPEKISAVVRQTFLFVMIASVLLTALVLVFSETIVLFAGADDELLEKGTLYFRIIVAAYPIEAMIFAATACLRGIGITGIAMIYNLLAGGLNVIGNYILIYGKFGFPEMGVAGAALSTSLSKCIALAIAVWYILCRDTAVRIRFTESFRFTRDGIGRVASVGMTTALEQILLQGGNIMAVKIVASMETASIAAFNVCTSINGLSWRPAAACQVASTTFTGQDLGEGRPEKARSRAWMVYRYALYFCAFMTVFMLVMRYPIARLFTPEEIIWRKAGHALVFDALSIIGVTTHLVLAGSLRAAGDQKYPLIASMISIWTARVLIASIFVKTGILSVDTARLCVGLDQMIRGTIVMTRFLRSNKYKRRE